LPLAPVSEGLYSKMKQEIDNN